ncbi:hypothetical protein L3V83_02345 [Thiotrichales bacterium 19X7-9]|nr:hypothetical protein [Thiotrichales bacterium 19X7-9]
MEKSKIKKSEIDEILKKAKESGTYNQEDQDKLFAYAKQEFGSKNSRLNNLFDTLKNGNLKPENQQQLVNRITGEPPTLKQIAQQQKNEEQLEKKQNGRLIEGFGTLGIAIILISKLFKNNEANSDTTKEFMKQLGNMFNNNLKPEQPPSLFLDQQERHDQALEKQAASNGLSELAPS